MSIRTLFSALVILGLSVAFVVYWQSQRPAPTSAPAKAPPAATVDKPVKEDELNRVVLGQEAEQSLDIAVAPVEMGDSARTRVYGGEISIPPGQTVIVAAPLGGVLKAASRGMPVAGTRVERGQEILQLLPLLTPEARTTMATAKLDAHAQIKSAQTQRDAAKLALDRAKRLLQEEAGSRRAVEEAETAYDIAAKAQQAAEGRHALLSQVLADTASGTATPIPIDSPSAGILRTIGALPNQSVPAGAALFEVADLGKLWVRVAVAVGDLEGIDPRQSVQVSSLTARAGAQTVPAEPAVAPPSANPQSATVDLFYEVENGGGRFLPGQRVGVAVPLVGPARSLSVPWSAIVHDIYGGTWVYERVAERTYARRRVAVPFVSQGRAVLAEGPDEGTPIVARGAQELFGVETGFSK